MRGALDPDLPDFFTTPLAYTLPAAPRRAQPHAYGGQDLAECVDRSALAIVEYVTEPTGTIDAATRAPLFRCSMVLRHLESPARGTPYPEVVARAREVMQHPRIAGRCTLIVDAHGPGAGVIPMLEHPAFPAPIVRMKATNGQEAKQTGNSYTVPKTALLDRLESALRTKKLRLAPGPLTDALFRELTMLQKELQPSGYVTYSTPIHDDLVMATAMAVWLAWERHAEYLQMPGPVPIVSAAGVLESMPSHPIYGPWRRVG